MAESARSHLDSILRAAGQLMAEVGYSAMSMRELAARSGVQPGSLYYHVQSKQDLLFDVLSEIVERRLDTWRRTARNADLQGYLRFALHCQRAHPGEELLLRNEARHLLPDQRHWLEQRLGQLRQPLRQAVEQAMAQGRSNVRDTDCVTEAILALIDSADSMRRRDIAVDEVWIESWLMRMSLALCNGGQSALAGRLI